MEPSRSNPTPTPRRPTGITVTGLLLGWLSIAGFGNALVIPNTLDLAIAPELLRAPSTVVAASLAVAAALYGLTALAAAIGLWRMRSWGPRMFLVWGIVVCGLGALFLIFVRLPTGTPFVAGAAFMAFMALVLLVWWAYITRAYVRVGIGAL